MKRSDATETPTKVWWDAVTLMLVGAVTGVCTYILAAMAHPAFVLIALVIGILCGVDCLRGRTKVKRPAAIFVGSAFVSCFALGALTVLFWSAPAPGNAVLWGIAASFNMLWALGVALTVAFFAMAGLFFGAIGYFIYYLSRHDRPPPRLDGE